MYNQSLILTDYFPLLTLSVPVLHPSDKIFVSGHRGMVGSAVCRCLREEGFSNLLTAGRDTLDLTDQSAVFDFFRRERPNVQIICAATVGGIVANESYPGDFIGSNLMIQTNLLEAARRFDCAKTMFLASSCIYPRDCPQPMKESYLLTGALEVTNQWYATAKLAGIKMAQAYHRQYGLDMISVLPANLYGPGDNFDLEFSHVIPALLRKIHFAKQENAATATVWGSGAVWREFMFVDDLAEAIVFIMRQESPPEIINIGGGHECTITELATLIKGVVGFAGRLEYDTTRPDGTPRKLLDDSVLSGMGWSPRWSLSEGLAETYDWFLQNIDRLREAGITSTA